MMSPEDSQVSICLRKFNLDEIENLFKSHLSALPDLEEDNQQQLLETLAALRELRAVNAQIKDLKQGNGRLTAKREILRRECTDLINMVEKMQEHNLQLRQSMEQEECDSHRDACEYEAKLQEVLTKYRQSENIYDEEIIRGKTETANKILSEVLAEEEERQNEIADLRNKLEGMKGDVPENILDIMGRTELEEKLNSLNNQCEKLRNFFNK